MLLSVPKIRDIVIGHNILSRGKLNKTIITIISSNYRSPSFQVYLTSKCTMPAADIQHQYAVDENPQIIIAGKAVLQGKVIVLRHFKFGLQPHTEVKIIIIFTVKRIYRQEFSVLELLAVCIYTKFISVDCTPRKCQRTIVYGLTCTFDCIKQVLLRRNIKDWIARTV